MEKKKKKEENYQRKRGKVRRRRVSNEGNIFTLPAMTADPRRSKLRPWSGAEEVVGGQQPVDAGQEGEARAGSRAGCGPAGREDVV